MLIHARRSLFGAWLAFAIVVAPIAAPVSAQILNSERIEQTFGSYGIDVLYSDERFRLANLYSEHAGEKVTRTLAFVEYPEIVSPDIVAEHRAILEGGSIGSTFANAGWAVIKQNLLIIDLAVAEEFAALMGIDPGIRLATHLYRLDVARNGQQIPYVLIAEMHHPDYLSESDLTGIYRLNLEPLTEDSFGLIAEREDILRRHLRLLYTGLLKYREAGLALRQ